MSDIENLRDTITPKGDQLNSDDLIGTTKVIRVTSVKRNNSKDQPISIEYSGMDGRPFKPCKSMRRVLIAAWSDDGRQWIGKSMKLYSDPSVKFGGVQVGGIRISQLSHMEKEMKIMLTASKGKRDESRITRLPTYPEEAFAEKSPQWIAAIKAGKITLDEVIDKAAATGILTESQIEILKGAVENGN